MSRFTKIASFVITSIMLVPAVAQANGGPPPVPEPSSNVAYLIGAVVIAGLVMFNRKKAQKHSA